jgi:hypothetical protein
VPSSRYVVSDCISHISDKNNPSVHLSISEIARGFLKSVNFWNFVCAFVLAWPLTSLFFYKHPLQYVAYAPFSILIFHS